MNPGTVTCLDMPRQNQHKKQSCLSMKKNNQTIRRCHPSEFSLENRSHSLGPRNYYAKRNNPYPIAQQNPPMTCFRASTRIKPATYHRQSVEHRQSRNKSNGITFRRGFRSIGSIQDRHWSETNGFSLTSQGFELDRWGDTAQTEAESFGGRSRGWEWEGRDTLRLLWAVRKWNGRREKKKGKKEKEKENSCRALARASPVNSIFWRVNLTTQK